MDVFYAEQDRAEELAEAGHLVYSRELLALGDVFAKRWLKKTNMPFSADVFAVGKALGMSGIASLNLSFEFGCTTGAGSIDGKQVMRRTLDWPLTEMAPHVVAAKLEGTRGPYLTLTYPGFVGALQGVVPGEYSVAVNQAPLTKVTGVKAIDWLLSVQRTLSSGFTPPAFLLRQVLESCATYDEAVAMLTDTPICIPAIYTIAGAEDGQNLVIERVQEKAWQHSESFAANHWENGEAPGKKRTPDSRRRRSEMLHTFTATDTLAWLKEPILDPTTVLAFEADVKEGVLSAVAVKDGERISQVLTIGA
jgi:hypothetical protein